MASVLDFNKTLNVLDLSGNCLGVEGVRVIARSLTEASGLAELSLGGNSIGRNIVAMIDLIF